MVTQISLGLILAGLLALAAGVTLLLCRPPRPAPPVEEPVDRRQHHIRDRLITFHFETETERR